MNKDIKAKWVEALRSGKFKQARCFLEKDGGNCCLGVLCRVMEIPGESDENDTVRFMGLDGYLHLEIQEQAGLSKRECDILIAMNDIGESFAHIADYIDKYL